MMYKIIHEMYSQETAKVYCELVYSFIQEDRERIIFFLYNFDKPSCKNFSYKETFYYRYYLKYSLKFSKIILKIIDLFFIL